MDDSRKMSMDQRGLNLIMSPTYAFLPNPAFLNKRMDRSGEIFSYCVRPDNFFSVSS